MARLRLVVVAQSPESASGFIKRGSGAIVKFYEPGTCNISGSVTTGTPFATPLYAGPSGGGTISTTQTADTSGQVVVYIDRPILAALNTTCDVGIEFGTVATRRQRERFEPDPGDLTWMADLPEYNAARPNLGVSALVEGSSSAEAANNTSKLHDLWQAVAAVGPGIIRLPRNVGTNHNPYGTGSRWWFNKNTILDTGINSGFQHVSLVGDGPQATFIGLVGTTGPFFSFQTVSTGGANWKPRVGGFTIYHDSLVSDVSSGADLLFGPSSQFAPPYLNYIDWEPDRQTYLNGAYTCVETKQSLVVDHCSFLPREDGAAPTSSACLRYSAATQHGLWVTHRTVFGGVKAATIGIDLVMTAEMDAMYVANNCLFSGLYYAIRHASNFDVDVAEVTGCQFDETHYVVYALGPGRFKLLNLHDYSSAADDAHVRFEGAAHNVSIDNIKQVGGAAYYFAAFNSSLLSARVTNCDVTLFPSTNKTAAVVISAPAATQLVATNNNFKMGEATGRGVIEVGAGVAFAEVTNNLLIPPTNKRAIIAPGGRSSYRVFRPNTIYDPDIPVMEGERHALAARIKRIFAGTTIPLLWTPSWSDTTTSTSLETSSGRTITYSSDIRTSDQERSYGNEDRCLWSCLGFTGASTPDSANLSFAAGGMTFIVFANTISAATSRTLLAKYDGTHFEYIFGVNGSNQLFLFLQDDVNGGNISAAGTTAVSVAGAPQMLAATWDGGVVGNIALYQGTGLFGKTTSTGGVFTQLRDTTAAFEIGARNGGTTERWQGDIGFCFVMPGVATADQLLQVKYELESYYATVL